MNKQFLMTLAIIMLVPGCILNKNKKSQQPANTNTREALTDVDIPVSKDGVQDFFDEDIEQLMLEDQPFAMAAEDESDYAWIEGAQNSKYAFKKVYFDYDQCAIKSSQKEAIEHDAARMKELIAGEAKEGKCYKFMIVGNSDSIFGQGHDMHNRILSEQRAKELKDRLVAAGVPADRISIIGRGSDVPEMVNGKAVSGTIEQQALNRRDEIQVVA
jgi:outer membrane protein OmpA-like peptidoglycan-associated protein